MCFGVLHEFGGSQTVAGAATVALRPRRTVGQPKSGSSLGLEESRFVVGDEKRFPRWIISWPSAFEAALEVGDAAGVFGVEFSFGLQGYTVGGDPVWYRRIRIRRRRGRQSRRKCRW